MRSKKQKIIVYILFLYSRVKSNILLLHLKDSSSLEKLLFATIIKTKIAKNKVICKTKTTNLIKTNKIAITKKIVNLYKCKNCKYINKSKEEYYLSSNKHFKLDLKNINN